jgi:hypothetical protein
MGTRIPGAAELVAELDGQEGPVRLVRREESHVPAMTILFGGSQPDVLPGLCLPEVPPVLRDQAAAWMEEIYPGIPVTDEEGGPFLGPTLRCEVAAGAPFITACLTAAPGSTIVLMYPEALAHPDSQFALGDLLSQTAAAGVHVVAATHSDCIFHAASEAVRLGCLPVGTVTIRHYRPGRRAVIAGTAVIDAEGMITEQTGRVRDSFLGNYVQPSSAPRPLLARGKPLVARRPSGRATARLWPTREGAGNGGRSRPSARARRRRAGRPRVPDILPAGARLCRPGWRRGGSR